MLLGSSYETRLVVLAASLLLFSAPLLAKRCSLLSATAPEGCWLLLRMTCTHGPASLTSCRCGSTLPLIVCPGAIQSVQLVKDDTSGACTGTAYVKFGQGLKDEKSCILSTGCDEQFRVQDCSKPRRYGRGCTPGHTNYLRQSTSCSGPI